MRKSLLPLLVCPSRCDAALQLRVSRSEGPQILNGSLCCPDCGRQYPIVDGIARMLPNDLETNVDRNAVLTEDEGTARKRNEMRARDAQVDAYDRMWYLNLFGLLEVPATLAHLSLGPHDVLLEGGCGTGRMTRDFAIRCEQLVSIDFSFESLRVCARKVRRAGHPNVDLIQADLCRLPFRDGVFDRVVSCQVLEHIPTAASRADAIGELARTARPGATVAISAYQHSLLTRLFGEKEGEHDGGIYFYRFAREEFRALLSTAFTVETITGALVYHYLARCRKDA